MTNQRRRGRAACIASVLLFGLCSGCKSKPTAEWDTASPSSVGLTAKYLDNLVAGMRQGAFGKVHSFAVIRQGKIVSEAYFNGANAETLHPLYSVTKSITSLLVGIAIDKGYIRSVNSPVLELLPPALTRDASKAWQGVTLAHLLSHTTGIAWDESEHAYTDQRNSHAKMVRDANWMKYTLSRPRAHPPGTKWVYNSGAIHLISAIIKQRTGSDLTAFADKHLLGPLSIRKREWVKDPLANACAGGSHGGLKLRTRDTAKIGQLVLNRGRWKGRTIVSQKWIDEATKARIDVNNLNRYGYQWWLQRFRTTREMIHGVIGFGYGGQILAIFPAQRTAVVLTKFDLKRHAQAPPLVRIVTALFGAK